MSKVTVKASFRQVVTYSKTFEMEQSEYLQWDYKLNESCGREARQVEDELFHRMQVDVTRDVSDSNDPELDDFGLVI
jgi:hypothetical protein